VTLHGVIDQLSIVVAVADTFCLKRFTIISSGALELPVTSACRSAKPQQRPLVQRFTTLHVDSTDGLIVADLRLSTRNLRDKNIDIAARSHEDRQVMSSFTERYGCSLPGCRSAPLV